MGQPRTTLDLDITVAASDEEPVALAEALGSLVVDDALGFVKRTRVLPVRLPDGTRLDLVAATLPYEISAIERAQPVAVAGVDIRICSPEDLIVHKMVSTRARDHDDVAGIIRRQGSSLDLAYLDPIIEGLAWDLDRPEILDLYRRCKSDAGI